MSYFKNLLGGSSPHLLHREGQDEPNHCDTLLLHNIHFHLHSACHQLNNEHLLWTFYDRESNCNITDAGWNWEGSFFTCWTTSGGEQAAACPCSLYVLNTGWLVGGWGFTFPTSWAVHVWAVNTRLHSEQRGISILSAHVLVIWRIRQSCWWYWFIVLKELSLHPFLCFYLGIS